jgi:ribosomal protein L7/L12
MAPVPRLFERRDCGAGRDFLVVTSDNGSWRAASTTRAVRSRAPPTCFASGTTSGRRSARPLFYQRGGRVEHEERHAHHSIVVTAHVYWGWTKEGRALEDAELPKLLDELTRPGGLLAQSNQEEIPSAWRAGERNGLPLTLGIVFDDLVAGIAALRTRVEAHSGKLELRLAEALSEDPLAHLRPSSPVIPRFDVVITDAGKDRAGLTRVVTEATGLYEWRASRLLESAVPITIARARFEGQAREIAGTLERAGAGVELRRNDG